MCIYVICADFLHILKKMMTCEKIGVIISYVGFIIGLLLIIGYINSRPKAIDVYKGKTELRITYEGNIPVDSAVVFKK